MNAQNLFNTTARKFTVLFVGGCLCACAAVAQAGQFSVDFEPPTYTTGNLVGQGGWTIQFGDGGQVTATSPIAGTQSATFDPSGVLNAPTSDGAFYQTDTTTTGATWGDGSTLSWLAECSAQDQSQQGFYFQAGYDTTPGSGPSMLPGTSVQMFNSTVLAYNSTGGAGFVALGSYTPGDVIAVTETQNFTAGTYTVSYNDVTSGGPTITSGALGFVTPQTASDWNTNGTINITGYGGGSTAVVDNIIGGTAPVPEPSTVALLAIGAVGLGVAAWRRRK